MPQPDDSTALKQKHYLRLEVLAVAAACLILIAPFLYSYRISRHSQAPEEPTARFSGTASCQECHADAFKKWQTSDHDRAMAEANDKSVLGDFDNVTFTDPYTDQKSRFFKDGGKFKVETEGPDGKPGVFTISHTFGFYPLQQYLIPFPGGRLQCLSIAWDIERKRWYRLPPYNVTGPQDWLHWTKGGETWNGMCAECHSTQLQKNFKPATNEYKTTWFEINVGCEACHGPASQHVAWARKPPLARPHIDNFGLTQHSTGLTPEKQIAVCAPCHARRYQLGDNPHTEGELLDRMVPSLLTEHLYFPDGQIKEEDYVYGSFVQSKMYHRGVRCSDCHDVHSLKTFSSPDQNNDLCLQCHRAADYDTEKHHFHKTAFEGKPSQGHLCVKCHMPGRYYMGIDYRPDHSMRIPRPDLSESLNTPNSCSSIGCHNDKPLSWVTENYNKWYGLKRKPHYGEVLAAAREHQEGADNQLRELVNDSLLPAIVRATALSLLRDYPSPANEETFARALASPEALLRHTALTAMGQTSDEMILKQIAPKLYDPVKAVRIEAALKLAQVPEQKIRQQDKDAFRKTIAEYQKAMEYNSDFAAQRYNLGNLARIQRNSDEAIQFYQAAIAIDDQFVPAKVNLAMEYNRTGQNEKAEKLFREVVAAHPQMYDITYSLGLLLAEMHKYEEAADYLGKAADGMPDYSRARYNQALALLKLKKWQEGAAALEKAITQDPAVEGYFVALANLYLNFGMTDRARELAEAVIQKVPSHTAAQELLKQLTTETGPSGQPGSSAP